MPRKIAFRNLPLLLLKSRESFLSHFRPILAHYGITEQQWRVMRALSEQDALEPWQICEACQILSPSLAGVLSRMEDVGLVERRRVPEDQRRVLVRLTAHSQAMVEELAPLIEAQYHHLEAAVGEDLLTQLYAMLDRVLQYESRPVAHVPLPETALSIGAQKGNGRKRAAAVRADQD
ncbi:homoprotocatechuate degradation operon regulator HpaR [Azoarcus sp. L1K30]|uniref:homoprotocatechuate degradation operon regulator HpaR n=1 Tax=Azoarcus sp. L1K30 TaxID=2820277 RepID=UPI001B820C4C|nr:homoprotocatechuate degradation operon regulator HpaR [Azoarcus sp. L1K30]MBR0567067.1 homoprotocatechuate degradation operon regulator HpaR [Azoarcus sp. L1K30]